MAIDSIAMAKASELSPLMRRNCLVAQIVRDAAMDGAVTSKATTRETPSLNFSAPEESASSAPAETLWPNANLRDGNRCRYLISVGLAPRWR